MKKNPIDYDAEEEFLSEEQIDYSSDAEEEAEEADQEEFFDAKKRKSKTKRPKRKRNPLLDVEAEVGDEDDEGEDEEDGYDGEDDDLNDFYGDEEEEAAQYEKDFQHRYPPRREVAPEEAEEIDEEAVEARLRRLYGRKKDPSREAAGLVSRTAMLPKPTDPRLWMVKCRIGREKAAVLGLTRWLLSPSGREAQQASKFEVFSLISRENLAGHIYIEAYRPTDVTLAVQQAHLTHLIFASASSKPTLVPLNEMADVAGAGAKSAKAKAKEAADSVRPGDWARIRRGKYSGDLAQIVEVDRGMDGKGSMIVQIRLLPRLSLRKASGSGASSSEKPLARPFDPEEAAHYGPVTKARGYWMFNGESYKDGMLYKEVRLDSLLLSKLAATREELEQFIENPDEELARLSIEDSKGSASPLLFAVGDEVEVTAGELQGMQGTIESIGGSDGSVLVLLPEAGQTALTLEMSQIRRKVQVGQLVSLAGGDRSVPLMVLELDERAGKALLLDRTKQRQIWVDRRQLLPIGGLPEAPVLQTNKTPSRDIGLFDLVKVDESVAALASNSASSSVADDLTSGTAGVVLEIKESDGHATILTTHGTKQSVSLQRLVVLQAADSKPPIIQDGRGSNQTSFRKTDRVVVTDGINNSLNPQRPATIIHLHGDTAFVRTLDTQEMLVRKTSQISRPVYAMPLPKQSPTALRSVGGPSPRALLGKSVTIAGGPYKGYVGIVKEFVGATQEQVRIELHTNSKLVTCDRDRVVVVGGSSTAAVAASRSLVSAESSAPAWAGSAKTPAWSSAKTPAWSSAKTPAWSSAKTPAWSSAKTPAWSSAKTPAWSSAKTPAWGEAKTPAWGSAKTPAWTSSTTPGWKGSGDGTAGSRTPAWTVPAQSYALPDRTEDPDHDSNVVDIDDHPMTTSSQQKPFWCIPGVEVRLKESFSSHYQPSDLQPFTVPADESLKFPSGHLEPVVPGKKDRVRVVEADNSADICGTLIGMDGPDAVIKVDGTLDFKIVPISRLLKIQ